MDIEREIKEAKETLWQLMVNESGQEKIKNCMAYIRYLEEDYFKRNQLIK